MCDYVVRMYYCIYVPRLYYVCINIVCPCSYHSALSEMAVHTFCKGVAMILGKPDNNQSQVSPYPHYFTWCIILTLLT